MALTEHQKLINTSQIYTQPLYYYIPVSQSVWDNLSYYLTEVRQQLRSFHTAMFAENKNDIKKDMTSTKYLSPAVSRYFVRIGIVNTYNSVMGYITIYNMDNQTIPTFIFQEKYNIQLNKFNTHLTFNQCSY